MYGIKFSTADGDVGMLARMQKDGRDIFAIAIPDAKNKGHFQQVAAWETAAEAQNVIDTNIKDKGAAAPMFDGTQFKAEVIAIKEQSK